MRLSLVFAGLAVWLSMIAAADGAQPPVAGLNNPTSICYGPKGLLYVAEAGELNRNGDGQVAVVQDGQARPFATGLDDPAGIIYFREALYVVDRTKIVRIDESGKTADYMTPKDFPAPPRSLADLAVDGPNGILMVSDAGDSRGKSGAIYRVDVRLNKINTVADSTTTPSLRSPRGLVLDGAAFVLVADAGAKAIVRVRVSDGAAERVATEIDGVESLVTDHFGRLFVTSRKTGEVLAIPRPGEKPTPLAQGVPAAGEPCLDSEGRNLIVPNREAGTLTALAAKIPGWEVDDSPAPVELQLAFPQLHWTGWDDGSQSGRTPSLRPILLTNAGDGSNRVFVATQQGVIHAFENSDAATSTKIFLDISDRVRYSDKENEEGFLGLAFHPNFAKNGELYVFYTDAKATGVNVVSRFRTRGADHETADPDSEEQLIRYEKPFWNHDGGTVAFGPNGYLYIAHGDGGNANDPHENGQNLGTLLGKVLRIDVDHKSRGKRYAIPKDNPFVSRAGAAPEVWAYGLRNIWRMAFDRKTGQLWAGDVGQNLFEEIDLLKAGGNYGWNVREGRHPFGAKGVDARKDLVEPIWEYDHELGKSITGGVVYRGKRIPQLDGDYLYADFVAARLWALRYDPAKQRVVANRPIQGQRLAAMSFGEDEQGEVYAMEATANGRGIYRFVRKDK